MTETDYVISSRPTVKIDGQDAADLTQGLLLMRVHEHVDGLYSAELQFGNWGLSNGATGFVHFDRQKLDFGKEVELTLTDKPLFKGKITALEAGFPEGSPPVLTALAEDRMQDLRMTRRTRTFVDMSDADVINQIASDHGLTPSVSASGPTHKVLAQVAQSDLAFLRTRARALGIEVWVDGTTLNAKPRTGRTGGTAITLGYGNELRELTVIADLAGQRSSVTVSGWDVAEKQAIKETARATERERRCQRPGQLRGGAGASEGVVPAGSPPVRERPWPHTNPAGTARRRHGQAARRRTAL
jgi:Bacteriophage probable baseplate hub protein